MRVFLSTLFCPPLSCPSYNVSGVTLETFAFMGNMCCTVDVAAAFSVSMFLIVLRVASHRSLRSSGESGGMVGGVYTVNIKAIAASLEGVLFSAVQNWMLEPALAVRVKIAMSWSYFDSHGQELHARPCLLGIHV